MYLQMLSDSLRACFSSMTCSSRKTFIMRDAVAVCAAAATCKRIRRMRVRTLVQRKLARCLKSLLQFLLHSVPHFVNCFSVFKIVPNTQPLGAKGTSKIFFETESQNLFVVTCGLRIWKRVTATENLVPESS